MTLREDLSSHEAPQVLGQGIRTYKPRRTRISERQRRGLDEQAAYRLVAGSDPLDLTTEWGAGIPVVLEIGFGTGRATAQMAAAEPGVGILAVDVHTPGVGDLLARVGEQSLTNIRVIEGDALGVLERLIAPHALAGVRTYFPDPWPKARHHKRRIVQGPVRDLILDRLVPGGFWHLATDWEEYAAAMQACLSDDGRWTGGVIARPDDRPITRYERRALAEGRRITDLMYRTEDTP